MKNRQRITKTESGLLVLSALFLCLMVGILYRTAEDVRPGTYTISAEKDDRQTVAEEAQLLNINTATALQLETLPGIGPVLAERIVADREANGPFEMPEDLKRVDGIGDGILEQIRHEITVEEMEKERKT